MLLKHSFVMDIEDEQISLVTLKEPLDLARISIDERIFVKLKNGRRLKGRLHAFDQHLNMVLGEVEETIIDIEIDEETYEEIYKEKKRKISLLFLRGEGVILMSPLCNFDDF